MARTPKSIEVETFVEEGRLTMNRNLIIDAIHQYEGKEVKFIIKRLFRNRSNKQNKYYWGVIVEHWKNIIREEWGEIWTPEETHEFLKTNLNYEEYVNENTGEILLNELTGIPIRKPKSTSENNTMTAEEYHEKCRQLAWNMFQYQIPLPDPKLKAKF